MTQWPVELSEKEQSAMFATQNKKPYILIYRKEINAPREGVLHRQS